MIDLHEIRSKCCGAWVGQKGLFYNEDPFVLLPKLPDPFYYCQECGKRCELEEGKGGVRRKKRKNEFRDA